MTPVGKRSWSKRLLVTRQHLGLGFDFNLFAFEGVNLVAPHLGH